MSQSPGSDPFIDRLPAEVQDWQDRGVITAEQAQAIVGVYDLPLGFADDQRRRSKLVTVLAIFGSLLVGLGVILFIAANWDEIPRALRLALIVVGIPAVYAIGYWLRYERDYERVGMAALLLAAVLYGAGIHLVAQVYNFPVDDPKLFTLWFLGVLPLAYAVRSETILVLAQILFLGAVAYWMIEWIDGPGEGKAIFVFAMYLCLGALMYGFGKLHTMFDLTRVYERAYEVVGIVVAMGAAYILSFRELHDDSDFFDLGSDLDVTTDMWVLFYGAAIGVAVAFAATAAIRLRDRLPVATLAYDAGAAVIVLSLAFVVVYVDADNDAVYPILFNLLLAAGIIGLVFAGYYRRRETYINLAIVFFGIDVFTRYFEFSWDLIDRSLIFVIAGLLLLGGGFLLERSRNRMVSRMGIQGDES